MAHQTPAGWYPTSNDGLVRYWDGVAWTQEIRRAEPGSAAPAEAPVLAARSVPTRPPRPRAARRRLFVGAALGAGAVLMLAGIVVAGMHLGWFDPDEGEAPGDRGLPVATAAPLPGPSSATSTPQAPTPSAGTPTASSTPTIDPQPAPTIIYVTPRAIEAPAAEALGSDILGQARVDCSAASATTVLAIGARLTCRLVGADDSSMPLSIELVGMGNGTGTSFHSTDLDVRL